MKNELNLISNIIDTKSLKKLKKADSLSSENLLKLEQQEKRVNMSFNILFHSLLDVIEEVNILNPFANSQFIYSSPKDFLKLKMKLLTIIFALELEESTVIIAFMYVDKLINSDKNLFQPNSIEL